MIISFLVFTSENLDQAFEKYMNLTLEEAVESECPLIFISFPSAKDPAWKQKYPGGYYVNP